jgi:hypothetical protein
LITGQITAGGGISGSDKDSQLDTIFLPDTFVGSVTNTSTTADVAGIAIDGLGAIGIVSAAGIGDISADGFDSTFVAYAAKSIGAIDAGSGNLAGRFQAGNDIGLITVPTGDVLGAYVAAGFDIAGLNVPNGGLQGSSLVAGRDVGPINVFGSLTGFGISDTSIVAGRTVAGVVAQSHTGPAIEALKIEAATTVLMVALWTPFYLRFFAG